MSASSSSPASGIAMRAGRRFGSLASDAAGMQLKARTSRVPGRNSADAMPLPLPKASAENSSPSRRATGLLVSSTILPRS